MNEYGFLNAFIGVPKIKLGDPKNNKSEIFKMWQEAEKQGGDMLVLPELCLTGSTCGDMFKNDELLNAAAFKLQELADVRTVKIPLFVGVPIKYNGKLYNCTAIIANHRLAGLVPKRGLSAEESRVFSEWTGDDEFLKFFNRDIRFGYNVYFDIGGCVVGVASNNYESVKRNVENGVDAMVIPGAVPGCDKVQDGYLNRIQGYSAEFDTAILCPNAGAGESVTDNVYTGRSFVVQSGSTELITPDFKPGLYAASIEVKSTTFKFKNTFVEHIETPVNDILFKTIDPHPFIPPNYGPEYVQSVINRQGYALASRMEHVGSEKVVLGLSGGLDSTWSLIAAVDAMKFLGKTPKDILCVSMPCFGTSKRTKSNSQLLAEAMDVDFREIDISESVKQHLKDIGHALDDHSVAFENAQARERTQVLMDIANDVHGFVLGTGDLSEEALGWCTYNGDHMSMYNVNATIPKTLMRAMTWTFAQSLCPNPELAKILIDIVKTPVSPELLPPKDGEISQKTEENVGPYELNDFFLYHTIKNGYSKTKLLYMASKAKFDEEYTLRQLSDTLEGFYKRFTASQFKRNCSPDGPQITEISLSPRGGLVMPSDMYGTAFRN